MRHKQKIRKFNRDPKHRKAMFRNLATNLVLHDRITTTTAKAKEMRPLIERLIRRAKNNDYQGNLFMAQTLFSREAIKRVKSELIPRFQNHEAGFTRIKYLGLRPNDKAEMCYIEFVNNPIEIFEKNQMEQEKEKLGLQSFWSWEHKLLQQEQDYFQNKLNSLEGEIQNELEKAIGVQGGEGAAASDFSQQIRKEVEAKYDKKRKFLEAALKRAQLEEKIHIKQEHYNRYERAFETYAFPPIENDVRKLQKF